ncbi:hypothetical protein V6K52_02720 [Knoellia sp. S7-12]|uniref:hypothetical protein n=1 Tax=Knoellia sp. S7-12 TaxID=3126698 RepID=UPI00336683DF
MISLDLARRLAHDAGVLWQPAPGDRFVIDTKLLTDEVFWVSNLTIEPQHFADQTVLGFNGTTEWALDSVSLDQSLWLPREDQLRTLLGDRFDSLRRTDDGWEVAYAASDGTRHTVTDADVECAYARALLTL